MSRDSRADKHPTGDPSGPDRRDNGLRAPAYVPLTDLDAGLGLLVLDALGRARIAAYLSGPPVHSGFDADPASLHRLFVASDDRVDARMIVAAAIRGIGSEVPELAPQSDPRDDVDTRSAFEAVVADWHIDTVAAIRQAERDLSQEDAEWRSRLNRPQARDETWLDEDHYVPPVPPPLPRLAAPTILAMAVIAVSIIVLGIGGQFGLASGLTFVLGILGLLLGGFILFSRLSEHRRNDGDTNDGDGSAI